ncbi:MAG: peptidoglycan recognition family protein [Phycisphaerales bacterium]
MSTMTSRTSPSLFASLPQGARPRRPHVVWGALVLGMTLVGGSMMLLEPRSRNGSALELPAAAAIESTAPRAGQASLIGAKVPLNQERWLGIVIHHSGSAMGSADSIARQQQAGGIKTLGYHFVVGNGQGAKDGVIAAGPRWLNQTPGAHAKGPQSEAFNLRTIGVCLVGDGESRDFTDKQVDALVELVGQLQKQFNIPASAVVLHRDVAATVSPGRLFPEATFRARLAALR